MSCSDVKLLRLLHSDTGGDGGDAKTLSHIETCTHCQTRLTELAAANELWTETSVALRDAWDSDNSMLIQIDRELADDLALHADRISLEFLDPPRHPELLGRLGRYDIERLLGAGGMGIVFKAFDTELHRPVAIKVLAPHLAHHGAARQRFARESQSAAAVVHENVVPIHNVESEDKLPYLVMQYVAGESLQARVDRGGPLSNAQIRRIAMQIASGLAAAHRQGLIHRDVKPANILLEEDIDRVLISDFGLARTADDASVTRSGFIAGTPHYMSPEQARGESIDTRSDLFGLGSVIYFMATGRPPFRADNAMAVLHRICYEPHRPVDDVNSLIDPNLADLLDDLLAKKRDERPGSAEQVAEQLQWQLQKQPRYRSILNRRQRNWWRRSRRVAMLTTILLITLICYGVLIATSVSRNDSGGEQVVRRQGLLPAQRERGHKREGTDTSRFVDPPVVELLDRDVPIAVADMTPTGTPLAMPTAWQLDESLAKLDEQMNELSERVTLFETEFAAPSNLDGYELPLLDLEWFDELQLSTAHVNANAVEARGRVPSMRANDDNSTSHVLEN